MEHISLTHAQYTKAIRTVSVYLCVAAYKRYTHTQSVLQTLRIRHLPKRFLVYVVTKYQVQLHYHKAVTNYTANTYSDSIFL